MNLTSQQNNLFDTFGYLVFPGLFARDIDLITDAFEENWANNGTNHDGSRRSSLVPFIDQHEYLSALLDDSRLDGIAESLLGTDYNYAASDGNFYVGDTAWHSDRYRWMPVLTFKVAFYLDPVTRDTGCLRVIPGSHKRGDVFADGVQPMAEDPREGRTENLWGVPPDAVPAISLNSEPGDLVIFDHRLKHASFGGGNRRRMFTLNYEAHVPQDQTQWLIEEMAKEASSWGTSKPYGDVMLQTAPPSRMKHLEQHLAYADQLMGLISGSSS